MSFNSHATRDVEETLRSLRANAAPLPARLRWPLLRADQAERWRLGDRLRVEAYLTAFPELRDDAEGLLDLIYAEVVLRQRHGEEPRLEDYLNRFPDQGDALRRQFLIDQALADSDIQSAPEDTSPEETLTRDQPGPDEPDHFPLVPGYEILEELGRGGMGIVYKARQSRPQRLVALKVIRAGSAASEQELTRFREEADTVAAFQHPHIVQIHEVGEWGPPGGSPVPFLALEYLEGGSLSQKARRTPLGEREAAEVVETLARTMHAAHERGIVHRDLKPDNVLLAADGTPKIADFGLAKRFDELRSLTGDRLVGTPAYMAPEQSNTSSVVGPPADVYGLGAILYELLTGRPPFRAATPLDTLDLVRTREPVPPRTLQPGLPRDLETICLKCLRKEPGRRYTSARELGDDLRRFLDGEPIKARPIAWPERLARWAAKRPLVAGLLLAVSLLTAAVSVGSPVALVTIASAREEERIAKEAALRLAETEKEARVRAEEMERQARDEADRATQATATLAGLFKASDPLGFGGYSVFTPRYTGEKLTARDMLDRGAEQVRAQLRHQPAALAHQLDTLGNVYRSLGLFREARPLLAEALEIRRKLGREDLAMAESLHNAGWLAHDLGDYETAEKLYREALALRLKLAGEEHPQTVASKFNLAWLLSEMGEAAEAESLCREVVAVRKRTLGDNHRDVGLALFALAALLLEHGKTLEGGATSLQALDVLRKSEGPSEIIDAVSLFQQGVTLKHTGALSFAEPLLKRSLALARKHFGDDYQYVALVLHELADCQERRGNLVEAEKNYRACLESGRRSTGLEHPKAIIPVVYFADLLKTQKRSAEGEELFREVLDAVRARYGTDHPANVPPLHYYAMYVDDRRADSLHCEADNIMRLGQMSRHRLAVDHLNEWGLVKLRLGRPTQAEPLFAEALQVARERPAGQEKMVEVLTQNLETARQRKKAKP